MSPEHPNGIDIGLEANESFNIRAAASGTVTHAGGDGDQALGISITIDHGNGVTTTYGHLSKLMVAEGDEVEIGQVIAIGGSTGISTGPHLHFEVRKNGDTVDPLHVLPTSDGDTTTLSIDCATTPFTLPSGSEALIDFSGVLETGDEIVHVAASPKNDGPSLTSSVAENSQVQLQSAIDFDGPDAIDSYDLQVTIDNASKDRELDCPFTVQRKDVPTTFYVRAEPPAAEGEDGEGATDSEGATDAEGATDGETPTDAEGTAEPGATGDAGAAATTDPTPEVTPTPNPWAGSPSYQVPSSSGGGVQTPSYGLPSGGAAGVQAPSYGVGGTGATATPAR
jgi:hypothetical protein